MASESSSFSSHLGSLLEAYQTTTKNIYSDPYDPFQYLERGRLFARTGFFDLAAADAYRALMLLESVVDPDGSEYVAGTRRKDYALTPTPTASAFTTKCDTELQGGDKQELIPTSREEYNANIGDTYLLLVSSLVSCGCLRDAYEFALQGIRDLVGEDSQISSSLRKQIGRIKRLVSMKHHSEETSNREEILKGSMELGDEHDIDRLDPRILNAQGYARRILYPWNYHEPDRRSEKTLNILNQRLHAVAPKCEVRVVTLPALQKDKREDPTTDICLRGKEADAAGNIDTGEGKEELSIQLGLFAKEQIRPGELLLRESSLLTATNRLHDDLCDACNSPLPELSSESPPVACEDCDDIIFCNADCRDRAQRTYHRAVCGQDGLESIGKDIPDSKDKADYLYLLLLGRAIAMAATQDMHPLDLPEVKYIWGDFHDFNPLQSEDGQDELHSLDPSVILPFSFQLNILQPIRFLEEMGLDPFTTLPFYDTWVFNTLYAKFRGTASGRLSTWDGGPEVCAVHPLWCLANHSCDPNVRWEWGGEITFVARTAAERIAWRRKKGAGDRLPQAEKSGIDKDEEILNHYCDINLPVKERREWAHGALGGFCQCKRCLWEASVVEGDPPC